MRTRESTIDYYALRSTDNRDMSDVVEALEARIEVLLARIAELEAERDITDELRQAAERLSMQWRGDSALMRIAAERIEALEDTTKTLMRRIAELEAEAVRDARESGSAR